MKNSMKIKDHFVLVAATVGVIIISCGGGKTTTDSKINTIVSPRLGMTLGRGFDPTKPLEPKGDCIENVREIEKPSWVSADGIAGHLTEAQIKSVHQLHQELSMSGSVAGESLWGGGGASFSRYEKFRSNEDSFTWLVNYTVKVGENTLDTSRIRLSDAARKLIEAKRIDDFYKMCGTEFIRSIKFGGKFTAVYEIESQYSELVKRLHTSVSAHGDFGAWGFAGSGEFESYFKDAFFKSVLKKDIEQIGGDAIDFTEISPDAFGEYMKKFQKELRHNNAVVVEIETASWDVVGVKGTDDFANWHRKETISSLYQQYRFNLNNLYKISDFMYWNQNSFVTLSDSDLEYLNSMQEKINSQQESLNKLASSCIERNECKHEGTPYISVKFPDMQQEEVTDEIGRLRYSIPMTFLYYGMDEVYDNRNVRFYEIPAEIHGQTGAGSMSLIVYETECTSANDWINNQRTRITGPSEISSTKNRAGWAAIDLTWISGGPQRLISFDKGPFGKCGVVKVSVHETTKIWPQLGTINKIVNNIKTSFTYR